MKTLLRDRYTQVYVTFLAVLLASVLLFFAASAEAGTVRKCGSIAKPGHYGVWNIQTRNLRCTQGRAIARTFWRSGLEYPLSRRFFFRPASLYCVIYDTGYLRWDSWCWAGTHKVYWRHGRRPR